MRDRADLRKNCNRTGRANGGRGKVLFLLLDMEAKKFG